MAITLYEKIESKGAADAIKILDSARGKAVQLKDAALGVAMAESAESLRAAERKAADRVKAARTEAHQIAKRASLESRKAVLDGVFNDAAATLARLPDAVYGDLVVKLVAADALTGDELFRVAATDRERFAKLFSSTGDGNLDLLAKRLGKPAYRLKLDDSPAHVKSGFLIVGRDFDVDHSYATILSDLRDATEPELAEILFSAGE